MLTERNPYDPVEIAMPSFWQMMKAGAAFTLGAGIVSVVSVVFYLIFILPVLLRGMLGALR